MPASADPIPHDPLLLATAVEAVVKAGQIQMAFIDSGFQVSKKGSIDLVTEADLAAERMFRALIAERYPEHTILAEEFGQDSASCHATHCWVFDPLDGTNNYAHGLPVFCASLALEINGRGEIGAIYDPTRRELFVAERGGGARLNGRPIQVSETSSLVESMLVTGFPYDVHARIPEIVGLFGEFVGQARAVRRLGSAALDLCYVAAGRMDGFWEQDLKPWTSRRARSFSRRRVEPSPISAGGLFRRDIGNCSPPTARFMDTCFR
jgi:myo-inositol-1(or 4)-monophosphatase